MLKELFHVVIFGHPYIKKNSQRTIWHKYLKKTIVVYSANYSRWKNDSMKQLCVGYHRVGEYKKHPEKRRSPFEMPMILKCHFYIQQNRRTDLSNLLEGVQDLLVEAEIIKDDNFNIIIGHDGSRVFIDKENPRIELWLQEASSELTGS